MENTSLSLVNQFPKDKFTLLIPIETVAKISEIQSPVINSVKISTNIEDKEIYLQNPKDRLYALTKRALTKLAEAAGIKQVESKPVLPSTCQKCAEVNRSLGKFVPCGQCPNRDIKYRVTISVPQLTGETLYFVDHHETRVEEATRGMTEAQTKEFLKHLPQICEAKALNGAIRTALQIKGTYTLKELEKPFVVAYLVPNLDNADVKRVAIESMFASAKNLFGNGAGTPPENCVIEAKPTEDCNYKDVIEPAQPETEILLNTQPTTQHEQPETSKNLEPSRVMKEEDRALDFCCDKCNRRITEKVWNHSIDAFGRPLCFTCQSIVRNEQRGAAK